MFLLAVVGAITYIFGRLLEVKDSSIDREANKLCRIMQIVGAVLLVIGLLGVIIT